MTALLSSTTTPLHHYEGLNFLCVANALDSASGTLEQDVCIGLERWTTEREMHWSLTFTRSEETVRTARRSVHRAESTHSNNLTLIAYRDAEGEVVRYEVISTLR
ncbi:hypothetical protein [Bowdeniella nasicola]|uniref:hypothetical protein n=1 Tax=Bowdeniella nasicola TaxID=208480 RepID=UPI0011613EEC|nr:hypothetical protein [Bowdeniella nasicola]